VQHPASAQDARSAIHVDAGDDRTAFEQFPHPFDGVAAAFDVRLEQGGGQLDAWLGKDIEHFG
jgi:hypothetical protein